VRLRWRECRAHRNPKQAHMSRRSRQGDRSLECWLQHWLLLLSEMLQSHLNGKKQTDIWHIPINLIINSRQQNTTQQN